MKVREIKIKSALRFRDFIWEELNLNDHLKFLTLEALETGSFSFLKEYLLDIRAKHFTTERHTKFEFD